MKIYLTSNDNGIDIAEYDFESLKKTSVYINYHETILESRIDFFETKEYALQNSYNLVSKGWEYSTESEFTELLKEFKQRLNE